MSNPYDLDSIGRDRIKRQAGKRYEQDIAHLRAALAESERKYAGLKRELELVQHGASLEAQKHDTTKQGETYYQQRCAKLEDAVEWMMKVGCCWGIERHVNGTVTVNLTWRHDAMRSNLATGKGDTDLTALLAAFDEVHKDGRTEES